MWEASRPWDCFLQPTSLQATYLERELGFAFRLPPNNHSDNKAEEENDNKQANSPRGPLHQSPVAKDSQAAEGDDKETWEQDT